jgi:Glucose-6-phosphate dehydrogenase subunit
VAPPLDPPSHSSGALGSLAPERVRRRHWKGTDVELGQVLERLMRIEHALALSEVGDGEHPHPRNCVLNLVVVCSDAGVMRDCDKVVEEISASHPLRAILFDLDDAASAGLDAEITTESHRLVVGVAVQREQVTLHIRGEACDHLASLAEPLLVPDVPTYLWWTGDQHLGHRGLRDALGFCDALIVDSARFERPIPSLLELAALLEQLSRRIGFSDMRWVRLRPWREAVAQCFGPAERRRLLDAIERVEMESGMVAATLLAGWLASALGWRIGAPDPPRPDGALTASATPSGPDGPPPPASGGGNVRPIQLVLRSAARAGHVEAVRLLGGGFAMTLERESGGARLRIDIEGLDPIRQRLHLPEVPEAELFSKLLFEARTDASFARSLAAAAVLLEAAR